MLVPAVGRQGELGYRRAAPEVEHVAPAFVLHAEEQVSENGAALHVVSVLKFGEILQPEHQFRLRPFLDISACKCRKAQRKKSYLFHNELITERLTARNFSSSIFTTSRSYVMIPFTSISTSVVWVYTAAAQPVLMNTLSICANLS